MSGTHRRRARPWFAVIPVVAAALCIPAAVAVLLLGLKDRAAVATGSARHGALLAATRIARDVLSYDYRTVNRDVTRAKSDATGVFARQYAATASQLTSEAQQTHAIVQATPSSPGVVSATRDTVVVLMFVDQASVKQVPGQKTPTTRIDQSRVQMTLTRDAGRWRVSQLAAL